MLAKLPQERVKINGAFLPTEGSDELITDFLEIGFTGYLLLQANGDKGLALFDNGHITAAYRSRQGRIVDKSVSALLAFREFKSSDCRAWASEVPLQYLRYVTAIYLGKEIIHPTPTKILNLKHIYETYHNRIKNGVLIVNSLQAYGIISITEGKWAYLTNKEEFSKIFALDDCVLSLYGIDDIAVSADDREDTALKAYSTLGKRIKETVIENLKAYFGNSAGSAIQKVSDQRFSISNYEQILTELADFLKLFVSDKKTDPFIENTFNDIENMVNEVNS